MNPKPLPFIVPPKPKEHIKPKTAQRREAKRMSIIASFSGMPGLVLCADTQETVSGYAKKEVEKIRVWHARTDYEYNLAIGAAADNGPYADLLTQELGWALGKIHVYDQAAFDETISQCLRDFYSKHIWPRQQEHVPQIETLIAFQPTNGGHTDVFHTSETANIFVDDTLCCIGVGSYLANFILDTVAFLSATKNHMLAAAAYMLKEVRENIDGCGKNATIWFFDQDGNCEKFVSDRLKFLEEQAFDLRFGMNRAFGYMTAVDADEAEKRNQVLQLLGEIRAKNTEALAKEHEEKLRHEEMMRRIRSGHTG